MSIRPGRLPQIVPPKGWEYTKRGEALPSPLSNFLFAGLCRLLIGENHAQSNQHGAEDAHEGNFFAQQQPAYQKQELPILLLSTCSLC